MDKGGKPIKFIEISNQGKLSVTADGMDALEKHQSKKISVVTVAGPYHSGKSFLCNRYVGKMEAFALAKSQDTSCTKGIWMWSELIPSKEDIDILLLDTEGFNSPGSSFDIDVKIFAFSTLLSSKLIYNQLGHISEQSVDDLSMITMMNNMIKFKH